MPLRVGVPVRPSTSVSVWAASRAEGTIHSSTASPDTLVGEPTAPDLEKSLAMEEVWILDSGAGSCQVRPIGNLGHSCPVIPSSSGHGNSSTLKAVGHNLEPSLLIHCFCLHRAEGLPAAAEEKYEDQGVPGTEQDQRTGPPGVPVLPPNSPGRDEYLPHPGPKLRPARLYSQQSGGPEPA